MKSIRNKQLGQVLYISLGLLSCLIVSGIFFFYLPYINAREEAAQKALLDARKAAEKATVEAAAAREREAAANARFAESQRQNLESRRIASEANQRTARSNIEAQRLQANELAQQRARNEQKAAIQRAAQEQRVVDELRLNCETTKKLPPSPNRDAIIYQACTRYDDAVRRQHEVAIQQQFLR